MLRAAVKLRTPLGMRAREVMDRGELVPSDIVMEMVEERLGEGDTRARGFVLDGCPRTIAQAETLADLLRPDRLDLVVNLDVPTPQVLRRLVARRVCVDCGTNYSVSAPPTVNWTCDVCGGEVIQREDDTEDAIRRRLELYEVETEPLLDFYRQQNQLVTVNGNGSAAAVTRRIVRAIDERHQALRGEGP
jgi:adenylate kinase